MIAKRLKYLRNRGNVTQRQMADAVGISWSTLAKYENGMKPTSDTIIKLSRYFKVTTDYLLGEKDESELGKTALSCAEIIDQLKPDQQDWMHVMICGTKVRLDIMENEEYVSEEFKKKARS